MSETAPPFNFIATTPVEWIEPVDGWQLFSFAEDDSDGFWTEGYTARRGNEEQLLHHCRWRFTPTQERFAFLVRYGFQRATITDWRGTRPTTWDDAMIDAFIAADAARAAA